MRIEAENLVKYRKSVNKTLFLTLVMERHGVEWEQKGTHEKHLNVLEYEKKMRAQEVAELDNLIEQKQSTAKSLDQQIAHLSKGEEFVIDTIERFDTAPEWQVPGCRRRTTDQTTESKEVPTWII